MPCHWEGNMDSFNPLNLWRTIYLVSTLSLMICQGFEFTFTAETSATSPNCGILRCSEELPDSQSGTSGPSRTISSLTVYKLNAGVGIQRSQWEKIATVTPQSSHSFSAPAGMVISGGLTDVQGSLTVEMSRSEDCMSDEFSCTAELVNSINGQLTLIKSSIKNTAESGSGAHEPNQLSPQDVPDTAQDFRSAEQTTKDPSLLLSLWEKLTCLEKQQDRLEVKVEGLKDTVKDEISDKLQASEIRAGDRLDRLENRLEDKLSGLVIDSGSRQTANGACNMISPQISAVSESLETIEKNLTDIGGLVYRAEAAATLSASVATELNSEMATLTTDLSKVSTLTDSLVKDVGDFRASYWSGALQSVDEFFDVLGSGRKEWRLAFRGTAYNNVAIYPAYLHGTGIPPEVEAGCKQFDHSLPCINHYRNRDALENWGNIDEVLFAIYSKGHLVQRITFNGRDSSYTSWFEAHRVKVSSWSDLKTLPHSSFSVAGVFNRRRFYIQHKLNGCENDPGWFGAYDRLFGCPYETANVAIPFFLYAPGSSVTTAATLHLADAIGIFLKYD